MSDSIKTLFSQNQLTKSLSRIYFRNVVLNDQCGAVQRLAQEIFKYSLYWDAGQGGYPK